METTPNESALGSRILTAVQAIAIRPEAAQALVEKLVRRSEQRFPNESDVRHRRRVAEKLVRRYSGLAALSGGATAVSGVVPGLGTAVAMVGGGATDLVVCMKLEFDLCMCLAALYDYDVHLDDAQHLAFMLAAGTTLEQAAAGGVIRMASRSGVRLLRRYVRGAALRAIKEMFKKIGVVFTRKALEKSLPLGIGVGIGSSANYLLTRYVGGQAIEWFEIDASTPELDSTAEPESDTSAR